MNVKNYYFSVTRPQAIIMGVSLLLICCLIFSMGTILGYKMTASDIREQEAVKLTPDETITPPHKKIPAQINKEEEQNPSAESFYQVQIGAYRKENEALKMQKRLEEKKYYVEIARETKDKADLFRIKIGKCKTKEEVEELAERIQNEEKLPVLIVTQ